MGYAHAYPYLKLIRHSLCSDSDSYSFSDLTANAKFKIINDLCLGQNLMKDVIFPWPKECEGSSNYIMNAVIVRGGVSLDLFMGQAKAAGWLAGDLTSGDWVALSLGANVLSYSHSWKSQTATSGLGRKRHWNFRHIKKLLKKLANMERVSLGQLLLLGIFVVF